MNQAEIAQVLEEYIEANWVHTPYSYEGLPPINLDLPNQPLLEKGSDDYVIFDIIVDASVAASVGTSCNRQYGYLTAAIYVKEDTGRRAEKTYKDLLNGLFRYQTISGNLRIKEFLDDGAFKADGWAIYACQWPFETEDYNP